MTCDVNESSIFRAIADGPLLSRRYTSRDERGIDARCRWATFALDLFDQRAPSVRSKRVTSCAGAKVLAAPSSHASTRSIWAASSGSTVPASFALGSAPLGCRSFAQREPPAGHESRGLLPTRQVYKVPPGQMSAGHSIAVRFADIFTFLKTRSNELAGETIHSTEHRIRFTRSLSRSGTPRWPPVRRSRPFAGSLQEMQP